MVPVPYPVAVPAETIAFLATVVDRAAIRDWLQIVTYTVTVLGVPIALSKYFAEKQRDQRNRERMAFEATNRRYADFLELCLKHDPKMFDLAPTVEREGRQQLPTTVLLAFATTMIETAFVWYQRDRTAELEDQWRAWERYIDIWLRRDDFRTAWTTIDVLFHDKFKHYINDRLRRLERESAEAIAPAPAT